MGQFEHLHFPLSSMDAKFASGKVHCLNVVSGVPYTVQIIQDGPWIISETTT